MRAAGRAEPASTQAWEGPLQGRPALQRPPGRGSLIVGPINMPDSPFGRIRGGWPGSAMSQNDLNNGRLVCPIGLAALDPAEFVIFRIGHCTADRKV